MNYCGINEAYNKSYDKSYYNSNNNNSNNKLNIIGPDSFDNYNSIEIPKSQPDNECQFVSNIHPAFFTAQGDYNDYDEKQQPKGTKISDLRDPYDEDLSLLCNENSDSMSLITKKSNNTNNCSFNNKKQLMDFSKIDHQYYIDKMIKGFTDDSDINSLASSKNNNVYNHVNKCKYCKTKINEKIKKKIKSNKGINNNEKKLEFFSHDEFRYNFGYDLKELLIIILSGLSLIFILDLLVKIGRKSNV